jgi:iron complex outermembrane receptor protein
MNEHMTITSPIVSANFDYRTGVIPSLTFNNGFDPGVYNPAVALQKYVTVYPTNSSSNLTSNNLISEMTEKAGKVDGRYDIDAGDMRSVLFGARVRQLGARANSYEANNGVNDVSSFIQNTGGNFLSDVDAILPRNILMLYPDANWIRTTVLSTTPRTENLQRNYVFDEKSTAVYGMADFDGELFKLPYRANAGVRAINTRMGVDSYQTAPVKVGTTTVNALTLKHDDSDYTKVLPSANIVFTAAPDFLVRTSASKTLQQAGIAELAPTIFISGTTAYSATGGNAQLLPTVSTNFDLSFEWDGKGSSMISGAVFYKDVTDVQTITTVQKDFEGYGLIPYTRPDNIGNAKIKGLEVGIQRFFDFLPAPFNNFGVIANFTYTDGLLDNGYQYPGLSQHSGNLVALYEDAAFSARLAYNTRDQALYLFNEGRPNYIGARSQLDLQMGYNVDKNLSVQFSALNLRPKDSATVEYGAAGPIQLSSYYLSETRYSLGMRYKF